MITAMRQAIGVRLDYGSSPLASKPMICENHLVQYTIAFDGGWTANTFVSLACYIATNVIYFRLSQHMILIGAYVD